MECLNMSEPWHFYCSQIYFPPIWYILPIILANIPSHIRSRTICNTRPFIVLARFSIDHLFFELLLLIKQQGRFLQEASRPMTDADEQSDLLRCGTLTLKYLRIIYRAILHVGLGIFRDIWWIFNLLPLLKYKGGVA